MTQPTLRPRLSLLPLALLGATATQAAPIQLPTQTVLGVGSAPAPSSAYAACACCKTAFR